LPVPEADVPELAPKPPPVEPNKPLLPPAAAPVAVPPAVLPPHATKRTPEAKASLVNRNKMRRGKIIVMIVSS
jgi:hypothetical protein